MKKLFVLLTLMLAIFVLASCGDDTPPADDNKVQLGGGDPNCSHTYESNDTAMDIRDDKKPSCTEAGSTGIKYCTLCNYVEALAEEIPATGHTTAVIPAVEATCAEAGSTAGVKCTKCNTTLKVPEVIPAIPHHIVPSLDVPATCTTTGYTGGTHCDQCLTTITAPEVVKPFGHERDSGEHITVTEEGYAPTCTETGLTDNAFCTICQTEVISAQEIPATGHTAKVVVDEENGIKASCLPTCSTVGYTDHVICEVCESVLEQQTEIDIDPAAHPEANEETREEIAAVAPTCFSDGTTAGEKCTACGEDTIIPEADTNRPEHTMEDVPDTAIAPDCANETNGCTADRKCSVVGCGHTVEGEVIEFEHILDEWITTIEPEVGKDGERYTHCTECGKYMEEVIPALPEGDDLPDNLDPDGVV